MIIIEDQLARADVQNKIKYCHGPLAMDGVQKEDFFDAPRVVYRLFLLNK